MDSMMKLWNICIRIFLILYTLKKQIGKGKFVLAEYEKIKRISMPLDEDHLLYITTEVECDALSFINKIKNVKL